MALGSVKRLAGWVSNGIGGAVDDGQDLVRGLWGDDDPDGVELEPLPDVDDPDLDALDDPVNDDETALQLENPEEADLVALLSRLDPPPPLPLTEPFSAGFGALMRRWIDTEPVGILSDPRIGKVLDLVGSRLTITVSESGISVTGLFLTRDTPWDRVQEVKLEDRYDLFTDRVVTGSVSMLLGRGLLPIPGLGWVLRSVLGLLENLVPDEWRESMRHETGDALAVIRRARARDIDLSGPLALVAFLSEGLTAAVADEAERRDVLSRN